MFAFASAVRSAAEGVPLLPCSVNGCAVRAPVVGSATIEIGTGVCSVTGVPLPGSVMLGPFPLANAV